jgi:hypothetical protein
MNGTGHYDKADGILADLANDGYDTLDDHSEYHLQIAAVHAHLAVAGALAALLAECKRAPVVIRVDGPQV